MEHQLVSTINLLERTPEALRGLLSGARPEWVHARDADDKWSVFEVVGHLAFGEETFWMPRVRFLLEFGEGKPLPPVDRVGFLQEGYQGSVEDLVDRFAREREQSLRDLKELNLTAELLDSRGLHPAFGSVRLSELLATWAVHDLTHLHQITRILARQYEKAVGPWTQYLGVLKCDAHGS
jgi:hypothetical protein